MSSKAMTDVVGPTNENTGLEKRSTAEVVAREFAEIKAMTELARAYPRDEAKCLKSMLAAAKRPSFADTATYSFPRGGSTITGASVRLARPLAAYWGHLRYGYKVVDSDEEHIQLSGFAHDTQTGAYRTQDVRFKQLIQRKNKMTGNTEWVRPDERDLRELVNRHGAFLERNCILALVPPDIVDMVIEECTKTLEAAESGNLKMSREDTLRQAQIAWMDMGVDKTMLEAYLEHTFETVSAEELVKLRGIYKAIKAGEVKIDDYFFRAPVVKTATVQMDLTAATSVEPRDPPGGSADGVKETRKYRSEKGTEKQ